ncbi:MAG: bifunctional diaminohydroxyphosphoribosylaminopyrimidine deaminase/5-amino-6-(5-phosphoribosylamino)uracil reductase RibD [Candidatus Binataceae bacterium]
MTTRRNLPAAARDERFMREALALAAPMLGLTSPNPAVGCVIVQADRRSDKVVGRGATAAGGRPHAETRALAEAGRRARGATAFVSFEPCAHQGQTPPCARALIEAGVARVVVGCRDPYPLVRGRGLAMLRRAGIKTTLGVLEDECLRLNEGFITRVTRGRPFGILKLATTLDGRIATASGDSRWISSAASRELVHRWRRECDAVMVGAGTVIADNPRLSCRLPQGRDPARVIVDAQLRCDPAARVFRQRSKAPTIVVTTPKNLSRAAARYGKRVEVIAVPRDREGVDLAHLMRELAGRGWSRVLIEGGARLAGSALRARIVDRVAFFVAPKILGGGRSAVEGLASRTMRDALQVANFSARPVGDDWLLEAELVD